MPEPCIDLESKGKIISICPSVDLSLQTLPVLCEHEAKDVIQGNYHGNHPAHHIL